MPSTLPNCDTCGKFHRPSDKGCSWAMVIPPDYWNGPDREIYRCKICTERLGNIGPRGGNETTHGVNISAVSYKEGIDRFFDNLNA